MRPPLPGCTEHSSLISLSSQKRALGLKEFQGPYMAPNPPSWFSHFLHPIIAVTRVPEQGQLTATRHLAITLTLLPLLISPIDKGWSLSKGTFVKN